MIPSPHPAFDAFVSLGRSFLQGISQIAQVFWFTVRTISAGVSGRFYGRQFLEQLGFMGFFSIPLVTLTSLFTGMVLALQSFSSFQGLNASQILPDIVTVSLVRELGPVLSGLMMAGRLGASIAAELATMRVTDQIDALVTLSTHPLRYLVVPRMAAALIALPLLTVIANVVGILGGMGVGVHICHIPWGLYLSKTLLALKAYDVGCGLLKATLFGFVIAMMGCYEGYTAQGGAQGVGLATTRGVVRSCILILCINYLLTAFFF